MIDNKKPVKLSLEPRDKLVFEGPFKRIVGKKLVIGNPSQIQSVAFKLMTNKFVVRPNIGVLGPDEKVSVEIFMKPTSDAGQKDHMILIKSALVFSNDTDLDEFWKVQQLANVWDAKIKCEIVLNKPPTEPLLQAGGDAIGSPDSTLVSETEFYTQEVSESVDKLFSEVTGSPDSTLVCETEFDAQEVSESVGKLFSEVLKLNDENQDISKDRNHWIMLHPHQGKKALFGGLCVLSILLAMMGAYYAKPHW